MDVGDFSTRFISCFTGMGAWRPGFSYFGSAINFVNNLSESYIPTFSSVQCTTPWSAPQQIPPMTYKADFINWEADLKVCESPFPKLLLTILSFCKPLPEAPFIRAHKE